MEKVSVLLADDHAVLVEGLRRILDGDRIKVVAEAFDGRDALQKIVSEKPQIAVIDMMMPRMNGLEILREIRKKKCHTRVIILTGIHNQEFFNDAMKSGAAGYILKNNTAEELESAIFHVMNGHTYISPIIAGNILKRQLSPENHHDKRSLMAKLTQTERTVLRYLAQNKSSREIGQLMGISEKTVGNHRANMCEKLNLKGPGALLHFAVANRYLSF